MMPTRFALQLSRCSHEQATPLRVSGQETPGSGQSDVPTTISKPAFEPPYLSLREAADWLCVSLSTLKRMIARGTLETVRIGERNKVPASVLEAYVTRDILIPGPDTQLIDNERNSADLSNT